MTVLGPLESNGFETTFIDLTTEDWNNQWMISENILAYGLSYDNTLEMISEINPRFVLITSMFTFEQIIIDELVQRIKKSFPKLWVIIGGVHASVKPEWHFEKSEPDFVIIGEGEITVVELLNELLSSEPQPSRVPGIAFKDNNGKIVKTKPREFQGELNHPWAIEKVLLYPNGKTRYIESMTRKSPIYESQIIGADVSTFTLFASRGCHHSCKYCTTPRRSKRKVRHIGTDYMFSQFLTARKKYNVSAFSNQADNFCVHQNDIDFLKMVRQYRFSSKDTQFIINNPNAFFLKQFFIKEKNSEINIELLKLLKEAGLNTITIAIETLNQRFNEKVNWKEIQPKKVFELCQSLRDYDFSIDVYMMYGFPTQSLKEFKLDLKFAETLLQYVDLVTWNSLTLLPGTAYYDEYILRLRKEEAFRQIINKGYGFYYPNEAFNLSNVDLKYFSDSLAPFGQSWI